MAELLWTNVADKMSCRVGMAVHVAIQTCDQTDATMQLLSQDVQDILSMETIFTAYSNASHRSWNCINFDTSCRSQTKGISRVLRKRVRWHCLH